MSKREIVNQLFEERMYEIYRIVKKEIIRSGSKSYFCSAKLESLIKQIQQENLRIRLEEELENFYCERNSEDADTNKIFYKERI